MADDKKYLMQFYATIKGDKIVVKNMNRIKKTIKDTTKSSKAFGSGITKAMALAGRSIMIIPIWMAMRSAFMGVINAIKAGVTFLKEWEYEMAQVRIVGRATETEINLLSGALLDLASNLGISHKQLGEGAKLWAQQGRAISEIIPLMESTAKMSMITGRTISQSVEDMTAIMKSYGVESNRTMDIVDSLTNVMLNHAITADTLASALRVVAPVAKTMGVSFEQLQAIITATHVVTRSKGNKVGMAWRTIFSRMATSAHKAIKEIAQVPVFLTETGEVSAIETVNMRNLGVVLDEVAVKWDSLSSAQKMNLAQAMAGKRRLTEFIAFMDNYTEGIRAQADALFSAGKAMNATSILSDTLKHRIEGLSQSWNMFVSGLADVGMLKTSVTFLADSFRWMGDQLTPATAHYRDFIQSLKEGAIETQRQITMNEALIKAMHTLETRNESIMKQETPERARQLTRELGQQYIQAMNLAGAKVPVGLQDSIQLVQYLRQGFSTTTSELERLYVTAEKETLTEKIGASVKEIEDLIDAISARSLRLGFLSPKTVSDLQQMKLEYADLAELINRVAKASDPKEFIEFGNAIKNYFKLVKQFGETDARVAEASTKVKELAIKQQDKLKKGIESEAETRLELLNIELRGIRTGKTKLTIEKNKLSYLEKERASMGESLQKEKDSLKVSISKQEAQLQRNIILEKEKGILEGMRSLGASRLQIEVQTLANMEARGIVGLKLRQQEEKIAQVMKNQVISSAQKLVSHEIELLRIRGLSGSQLLVAKMAIEDAVFGRASETTELQRQLDMEKEITKEKQNQIEYSEESKKLYQVAVKYGKDVAKAFAEVLRGKEAFEDLGFFDMPDIFEKMFPKFMERKKLTEFFKDEGKKIPIKEKLDTKEIQEATARIAQRQKTTDAFRFGIGIFDTAINRFGIAIDKFASSIPRLGVEITPSPEVKGFTEYEKYKRGLPYEESNIISRKRMEELEADKDGRRLDKTKVITSITAPINIPVEIQAELGITSTQLAMKTLKTIIEEVKKKQSELSREFNNKIEYFT